MKLARVGSMIVVCLLTAAAARSEAQSESRERFVCTFGASQRFVDIYRGASRTGRGGECRVDYTKGGRTQQVWSANGDYAYCVKKALALVTTLSKGHFSCKPQTLEPPDAGDSAGARAEH